VKSEPPVIPNTVRNPEKEGSGVARSLDSSASLGIYTIVKTLKIIASQLFSFYYFSHTCKGWLSESAE